MRKNGWKQNNTPTATQQQTLCHSLALSVRLFPCSDKMSASSMHTQCRGRDNNLPIPLPFSTKHHFRCVCVWETVCMCELSLFIHLCVCLSLVTSGILSLQMEQQCPSSGSPRSRLVSVEKQSCGTPPHASPTAEQRPGFCLAHSLSTHTSSGTSSQDSQQPSLTSCSIQYQVFYQL